MKTKKPFILQIAVFSALRRLFRRWPAYTNVLNRCKSEYFIESKKGKKLRRVRFECESCHDKVDRKKFSIDHKEPVVPVEGIPILASGPDYSVYIERLFCPEENLQGLCKSCHDKKTKLENKNRRNIRKMLDNKDNDKAKLKKKIVKKR